jgi:hypothetical protein
MCDSPGSSRGAGGPIQITMALGGATSEDVPDGRCTHCLRAVPADLGYENSVGEVLCGPCYFVLWGPRARSRSNAETEAKRLASRRDEKGRPIWVPGTVVR